MTEGADSPILHSDEISDAQKLSAQLLAGLGKLPRLTEYTVLPDQEADQIMADWAARLGGTWEDQS